MKAIAPRAGLPRKQSVHTGPCGRALAPMQAAGLPGLDVQEERQAEG